MDGRQACALAAALLRSITINIAIEMVVGMSAGGLSSKHGTHTPSFRVLPAGSLFFCWVYVGVIDAALRLLKWWCGRLLV